MYALGVTYARLGRKTDFEATVELMGKLNPQAAKELAAVPLGKP